MMQIAQNPLVKEVAAPSVISTMLGHLYYGRNYKPARLFLACTIDNFLIRKLHFPMEFDEDSPTELVAKAVINVTLTMSLLVVGAKISGSAHLYRDSESSLFRTAVKVTDYYLIFFTGFLMAYCLS